MNWTFTDHQGASRSLDAGTYRLGRETDNDIVLPDDGVSRYHEELTVTSRVLRIKDLGSTNGTFVNGQRVTEDNLSDDGVIGFGQTCHVRLQRQREAQPAPVREDLRAQQSAPPPQPAMPSQSATGGSMAWAKWVGVAMLVGL